MTRKLFLIVTLHSVIFWFQVACLGYLLYAGLSRSFSLWLVIPASSILLNGLLLLLNRGRCPFTALAEKEGAGKGPVTDLFLPGWAARNVFRVGIVLFPAEIALLALRYFTGL
ncbi:MAG: hypothetical protein C4555_03400 [Dehalococcoidia bacterium]|jgi:hypothetical protein|nr:MAG: hypothetical protein C4555_03400 [Dehalococcoidia bacterium]